MYGAVAPGRPGRAGWYRDTISSRSPASGTQGSARLWSVRCRTSVPTAYGPVGRGSWVVAAVGAAWEGAAPGKAWAVATGVTARSIADRAMTAVRPWSLIVMSGTLGGGRGQRHRTLG